MAFGSTLSLNDTFRRPTVPDAPTPVAPTPIDATPVAPTVAAPVASNFDQYSQLSQVQEQRLQNYLSALEAGETLKPKQLARVEKFGTLTGQDFLAPYSTGIASLQTAGTTTPVSDVTTQAPAALPTTESTWLPTSEDLYEYLNPSQEKKLTRLANLYASGELEGREGKIRRLENLLGKGQLGTIESFFGESTYTTPTDLGFELPAGVTAEEAASYISQYGVSDPTRVYQYAASLGISPEQAATLLSGYGTTRTFGGPTVFGSAQLEDIFSRGQEGYQTAFTNLFESTFGSQAEQAALESRLGLAPGSLSTSVDPTKFANLSIEDIQRELSTSNFNVAQEAFKVAEAIGGLAGLTPDQINAYAANLMQGRASGDISDLYQNALTSNKSVGDIQYDYLSNLAVTNPEHEYFKNNPDALSVFTPIDELESVKRGSGQYGTYQGFPILSAAEADRLLGDDPFKRGGVFSYGTREDEALGWDLHSKYLGSISNGAGVYGVQATNDQINQFSRVEDEIAAAGGLKTSTDSDGNERQGIYIPAVNEDGQAIQRFVPIEQLFATYSDPDTGANDGAANYQLYQQTLNALNSGAESLGLDTSQTQSIGDLYQTIDKAAENVYVVTGRADTFDPEIMEELGLLNKKGEVHKNAHAQIVYTRVGDKLVPARDANGNLMVNTFKFQDPETSKGFIGDFVGAVGELMSLPPVQLAMLAATGGLENLFAEGAGYGAASQGTGAFEMAGAANLGTNWAASNMAATIGTTLGSTIGLSGPASILLGNTVMSMGIAGLQTGLSGGDWDDVLTSAAAGGLGTGIAGLTNSALNQIEGITLSGNMRNALSNIVGGAASVAATGQDVETYLKNKILGSGLGWLIDNGIDATTDKAGLKGTDKQIFKALVPVMLGEKLDAKDLLNIAKALDKADYFKMA